MRHFVIAAALSLLSTPLLAQAPALDVPAGEYVLDKTHTSVTWRISHLGLSNYTARFTGFDSTITLDPVDVTKSSIVFTIDANSVRTDFPFPEKEDFDKVIATQFLKADKHPQMRFESTSLTPTDANSGTLTGNLTLAGVTRPATFTVTLNGAMPHPMTKAPALGLSARGIVKRSDFGLTEMAGALGDEVEIWIETEYAPKP